MKFLAMILTSGILILVPYTNNTLLFISTGASTMKPNEEEEKVPLYENPRRTSLDYSLQPYFVMNNETLTILLRQIRRRWVGSMCLVVMENRRLFPVRV
jgi:hypothetical protein